MGYMYIKALAAQQGYKTLTVACQNIKTWNNQLNVKNLEKSTELSELTLTLREKSIRSQ